MLYLSILIISSFSMWLGHSRLNSLVHLFLDTPDRSQFRLTTLIVTARPNPVNTVQPSTLAMTPTLATQHYP
jgi:hypothetical protein